MSGKIYSPSNYFHSWMRFERRDEPRMMVFVSYNTPDEIKVPIAHDTMDIQMAIDEAVEAYYNRCNEYEFLITYVKEGVFGNTFDTMKALTVRHYTSREIQELERDGGYAIMNIIPLH